MMKFILSPATAVGMYIIVVWFWSLNQAVAFTTQEGYVIDWAMIVAALSGVMAFAKID